MHPKKRIWLWLLILGGASVPASYLHGMITYSESISGLWGGVPATLHPLYTVSMVLAAVGFFLFTGFILFHVDPERQRAGVFRGFGVFILLYALILIPSALWMPLTLSYMERPSDLLWWTIRGVLFLVGLGSVGLFPALAAFRPEKHRIAFALALSGLSFFCWQTAVLDAVVWPCFFPKP